MSLVQGWLTHTSLVTHRAADTYLGAQTGGRQYHQQKMRVHSRTFLLDFILITVTSLLYFILIKILKNALFLQPLYFESNFEKCWSMPRHDEDIRTLVPSVGHTCLLFRVLGT